MMDKKGLGVIRKRNMVLMNSMLISVALIAPFQAYADVKEAENEQAEGKGKKSKEDTMKKLDMLSELSAKSDKEEERKKSLLGEADRLLAERMPGKERGLGWLIAEYVQGRLQDKSGLLKIHKYSDSEDVAEFVSRELPRLKVMYTCPDLETYGLKPLENKAEQFKACLGYYKEAASVLYRDSVRLKELNIKLKTASERLDIEKLKKASGDGIKYLEKELDIINLEKSVLRKEVEKLIFAIWEKDFILSYMARSLPHDMPDVKEYEAIR